MGRDFLIQNRIDRANLSTDLFLGLIITILIFPRKHILMDAEVVYAS